MPSLENELMMILQSSGHQELTFDGELTRGPNFSSAGAVRAYTETLYDVNFHLFEALTQREFDGVDLVSQETRWLRLRSWMACGQYDWVKPERNNVMTWQANDEASVYEYFTLIRKEKGPDGLPKYEGIIVKDPLAPYKPTRNYGWMKVKGCQTTDLEVCGSFEHRQDPKLLGGFFVKDATGRHICEVGGGFTAEERIRFGNGEYFAANCMYRIIEVEYQDITPAGSLRNPVFVRFRDDKADADTIPIPST
jgi:hypothetical protein